MRDGKRTLTNTALVVAAALIATDGRVLVQRRPAGKAMAGLWEFPGGKVDAGETPEAALVRELQEELGIAVQSDMLFPVTFASAQITTGHLVLLLYRVESWTGEPTALHADALLWALPAELDRLDMPPADVPLVAAIRALPIRSGL
jgi:8-oxo-dGTP diphosphatase